MAKWTKRILITLGILIVLLLAAAVLIPILFKDKIEAAVKAEVNKNINAVVDWGEWDITTTARTSRTSRWTSPM